MKKILQGTFKLRWLPLSLLYNFNLLIVAPEVSDHNAYQTLYRMTLSDIITEQTLVKLF
jgi:hypothetical protein